MIVLDTNVVSEVVRARPNQRVIEWIDAQVESELFLTAITAAELLFGVERMPIGQRRTAIFSAVAGLLGTDFDGRILPFDALASVDFGRLAAERERAGRPVSMADGMIAAIALSSGDGIVATRNTADFEGVGLELINPWDEVVGRR
jgi:predicted nucleic acid-binding protein